MDNQYFSALLPVLAVLYGSLAAGSILRFTALRNADAALRKTRLQSLRTWWILALICGAALLAGRAGICLMMALTSILAFREFIRLLGLKASDPIVNSVIFGIVLSTYLLILFGKVTLFWILIPQLSLLLPIVLYLLRGQPREYLRSTTALFWGSFVLIFGLSHSTLLLIIPETSNGPLSGAEWFLFLIALTECNDIGQAIIGRRFGSHKRHRIAPTVSPNKTWEGFIGGLAVTILLGSVLAYWMTDLYSLPIIIGNFILPSWATPVFAGTLIALAGFAGDLNMSAIKRDVGVKDSSTLLPGMGGLIDRIDSLTISAPLFFYFVQSL